MSAKNYTSIDYLLKKPKQPISKPKETEPESLLKEAPNIKEVIEHKPEAEVRPYLQIRAETIELPPDLKKMGLKVTTSSQFISYQNIKLPISDDKIIIGLHTPVSSSIRWLATLAIYLLKKAHLTLRVIHGKVIRVFQA